MANITLMLSDSEHIDIDGVVATLQARFIGTVITEADSFEAKRKRAIASMAELAAESTPINNPQRILQGITNTEMALGPGVDVSIPIGSSVWVGHIWAKDISLYSDASLPTDGESDIKDFLRSLNVGRIHFVE